MAGKPIKFGAAIPQVFFEGPPDMELVRKSVQRAEQLGFDSLWTQDQVAGFVPLLECLSLLCYVAAITTKVRLGISVIVTPVRNPVQLAKNISTLDHLSGGRVIVGVGIGPHPDHTPEYYVPFGIEPKTRLKRFNEGLDIMKSLWTEPKTNIKGEFFTLDGVSMEPKPIQKPHPPIWIGGRHPDALRRSVRRGDGFMGSGPTSTKDFAGHVALVRQFLEEEGRDPATFPIAKRCFFAVDDDEARAKARLDEWFANRYPWILANRPNMVEEICVWGKPERCVEGINAIVAAGAELVVPNPLWDYSEQMERLVEEIIPHVSPA